MCGRGFLGSASLRELFLHPLTICQGEDPQGQEIGDSG